VADVRVYVNPVPQHALELLEYLLGKLTSEAPVHVGAPKPSSPLMEAVDFAEGGSEASLVLARQFFSCKIAGPRTLGSRSDGILVYCPTRGIADAVCNVLKGADDSWFNPETPRLTEKPTDLDLQVVGVSIAQEPPQIAVGLRKTSKQSFGSLRCELIAAALMEAEFDARIEYTSRDFTAFCKRVAQAFRGYGLDPNSPAWNA
jgi:hypothetical protein